MTSTSLMMIGRMSLNISFIVYLLVYLPQILHNRRKQHLPSLSLPMHYILCSSYCLDVLYGFSSDLQWQYKTVSIVGLILLIVQHVQLSKHYQTQNNARVIHYHRLFLLAISTLILYFFIEKQATLSEQTTQTIGFLSRIGFLMYTVPQIIKNKTLKSTHGISIAFVYLSLTLSILDMTSAWCLDWGWPNKIGPPLTISLSLIMLRQRKKYL